MGYVAFGVCLVVCCICIMPMYGLWYNVCCVHVVCLMDVCLFCCMCVVRLCGVFCVCVLCVMCFCGVSV